MSEPILQVALDVLELHRALQIAREAVTGGAQWIEAGTPLIKSEGLDAVRALRKEFGRAYIVADLKTMDAGRTEMEAAAKAGANLAMVMGVASESTIQECVEAGRNYGIDVGVDLLGVEDPAARAAACAGWGVNLVSVHCPIDDQMRGQDPFDRVRRVRQAVSIRVSVAGGIHPGTAAEAVRAGADVVIVGGAITKSEDAAGMTRTILDAMRTGRVVETDLFRRRTGEDIREVFLQTSTPNISDALHRGGVLNGIQPVSGDRKMVGRARTVRTYPGDWAKPVEAIAEAGEGEVIVIDAGGTPPAVWGELASESCLQQKVAGVVIDGAIRDVDSIREIGFAAFARHVCPHAGEPKGFGEMGVTIKVGGQTVSPGDWIVGDANGVVCIPQARAVEYANRAMDVLEKENRLRGEIRRGSTLSQVTDLVRWEKTIAEGGPIPKRTS